MKTVIAALAALTVAFSAAPVASAAIGHHPTQPAPPPPSSGGGNIGANPVRHPINCDGKETDIMSEGGAPVSCPSSGGGDSSDIKPEPNMSKVPARWSGDPHMLQGTYPK